MNGVVSLLDDEHYQQVEALWAELAECFGLQGVYITPFPHFSYQVADYYDTQQLEPILRQAASKISPFQIKTTGLGIFTGTQPVLYIPVVRSLELSQVHQTLWQAISQAGQGILDYYMPENWMPHITIGFGDLQPNLLPEVTRLLGTRDFTWEMTINHFAFIDNTGIQQQLLFRCAFGTTA